MAITSDQVKDVEQLRKSVHDLVGKGITDEYLLATYNGIIRRLDDRLPKIRQRAEGKSLKEESRNLVRRQREAMSRKSGAGSTSARPSSQKAS